LSALQLGLGFFSGTLIGFSLGIVGGGGSILAVPLLLFVVGVPMPHVAIGTTAAAVSASAGANLFTHTRSGIVKWRCAAVFAAFGVLGAAVGSTLGMAVDGDRLLALFGVLMLVVAGFMLRKVSPASAEQVHLTRSNAARLAGYGFLTGGLAGFFGIGGGFLIVPGLIFATGMPILNAIASSLLAVFAFGLTTALNYARAGLVDWPLVGMLLGGGVLGGIGGARAAHKLSAQRGLLNTIFAAFVALVAVFILVRSAGLTG
jgi:uncharacterized membrane protein YfcA